MADKDKTLILLLRQSILQWCKVLQSNLNLLKKKKSFSWCNCIADYHLWSRSEVLIINIISEGFLQTLS